MLSGSDSLEDMRRKIMKDAEEEALKIMTQASKRADEILEAAKKESSYEEEVDRARIRDAHKASDQERVSEALSEYSSLMSSYKAEILDSIYKETLRRVRLHVDSDDYQPTLEGLIIEAAIALGGGEITIQVNQEDKKTITGELLSRASGEITQVTGKGTLLTLNSEHLETVGGARLVQVGSKASVDNTFEGRLKRLREQKQSELENMVFG